MDKGDIQLSPASPTDGSNDPLLDNAAGADSPMPSPKTRFFVNRILTEEKPPVPRVSRHLEKFVILPGSATGKWWLELWDVYISALVLVVAYFEPFVFALYEPGDEPQFHVVINFTFNMSFTIDMLMQFFIATQHSQDSVHQDLWQRDVKELAKAYCSWRHGWFWADLVTVLPGWYETLLLSPRTGNPLYLLRILRLLQTARLGRLSKLSDVLNAHLGFPYFIVEVCKFFVITTLTCHWMACLWVMVEGKVTYGRISYSTNQESWLSALIKAKGDSCNPDAAHDPICVLVLAYYWAAMTLTSVGYGDITPQNKMEYAISVVCMLVVGYVWAFIVGSIVSVLSNVDPSSAEFKHGLDELGKLMHRRGLSHELKVRLRRYMHETREFMQLNNQRQLVEQYLSDGLQREIAAHSVEVRSMLKNVYWMRELQEEAILDITRGLQPRAYGPNEFISMRSTMLFMQRGLAMVKKRVLSRGDIWGQNDILMETPQLIDSTMPWTLSFVEIFVLAKSLLVELCHCYPRADQRLRRAQVRTAVARGFIYCARKEKANKVPSKSKSAAEITGEIRRSMPRRSQTCESSFANPGLARIEVNYGRDSKDGDLKPLLKELLQNQHRLDRKLNDLTDEVRANKGTSPFNIGHNPFSSIPLPGHRR